MYTLYNMAAAADQANGSEKRSQRVVFTGCPNVVGFPRLFYIVVVVVVVVVVKVPNNPQVVGKTTTDGQRPSSSSSTVLDGWYTTFIKITHTTFVADLEKDWHFQDSNLSSAAQ
jgi:hypothetical protein